MKNKNYLHCLDIIEEMEAYHEGVMYSYNGDTYNTNELERTKNEEGEEGYVINGEFVCIDDMESLSLYNYFDDCLDIKFTVDSGKEYCGVRIMMAYGGPNIYIDTNSGCVELYWWSEDARASMSGVLRNAIDEIWEDYYNCL